jgi:hypothetical protein
MSFQENPPWQTGTAPSGARVPFSKTDGRVEVNCRVVVLISVDTLVRSAVFLLNLCWLPLLRPCARIGVGAAVRSAVVLNSDVCLVLEAVLVPPGAGAEASVAIVGLVRPNAIPCGLRSSNRYQSNSRKLGP